MSYWSQPVTGGEQFTWGAAIVVAGGLIRLSYSNPSQFMPHAMLLAVINSIFVLLSAGYSWGSEAMFSAMLPFVPSANASALKTAIHEGVWIDTRLVVVGDLIILAGVMVAILLRMMGITSPNTYRDNKSD